MRNAQLRLGRVDEGLVRLKHGTILIASALLLLAGGCRLLLGVQATTQENNKTQNWFRILEPDISQLTQTLEATPSSPLSARLGLEAYLGLPLHEAIRTTHETSPYTLLPDFSRSLKFGRWNPHPVMLLTLHGEGDIVGRP